MSDFTLSQIAPFIEKDSRTLRRWCQAGVVPGAYQTPGGHWRIRGESRKKIIWSIHRGGGMAGMQLRRLRYENAYPAVVGLQVRLWQGHGVTPQEAWATIPEQSRQTYRSNTGKKNWRLGPAVDGDNIFDLKRKPERRRYIEASAISLLEELSQVDEMDLEAKRSAVLGYTTELLKEAIVAGNLKSEAGLSEHLENVKSAASEWDGFDMTKTQWRKAVVARRSTAKHLAETMSIPLRTFYRWFPRWRQHLFREVRTAVAGAIHNKRRQHFREGGETVFAEWFDYDAISLSA